MVHKRCQNFQDKELPIYPTLHTTEWTCLVHLSKKEGRKELKRCGTMFTCLASRAVHIEITNSAETDSFILALRGVIVRHGNLRSITSDNSKNFVGANNELKKDFNEMNHQQI